MKNRQFYQITSTLILPDSELSFSFSRSSGKGGQSVNKVNSRVSLSFAVDDSPNLSGEEKALIKVKLAGRINNEGILRLDADRQRSQRTNKEEVINRFITLLRQALQVQKKRRGTRPTRASNKRRLHAKKHRSRLKKESRGKVRRDE